MRNTISRTFPGNSVYSMVGGTPERPVTMTTSTDQLTIRLVREAQMGDREAFAAIYHRYGALVFRTAYLLLGDLGRAEELTQDVFVRLHGRLGDYQPERGAFTTWLHSITVNACLNAQRRQFLSWLSLDR